jgi:phosphatidate cytidylyltransferase
MAASEGSSSRVPPTRWIATELGTRVISALVLGFVALAAAYAGGWPFTLFWLAAGIAVAVEWVGMTRCEPRRPIQVLLGTGLAALTLLYLASAGLGTSALVGAGVAAFGAVLARSARDRLWVVSGFCYAIVISLVPPIVRDRPELGLVGLLWMFAVVWTTDVAAYFTGRRLGGPKLWPRVSPKKTWSGFVGGIVAATIAGVLVATIAQRFGWTSPAGATAVAVGSAVASIASQLGDLGESGLKRRFDVKDSSHLIPGHGGVMDRLDGFWAVAVLVGIALLGAKVLQV